MDKILIEEINEWIKYSKNDFLVAEHLFNNMYPRPLEIICFHCQQSIEKILKAYLVAIIKNPKKHIIYIN